MLACFQATDMVQHPDTPKCLAGQIPSTCTLINTHIQNHFVYISINIQPISTNVGLFSSHRHGPTSWHPKCLAGRIPSTCALINTHIPNHFVYISINIQPTSTNVDLFSSHRHGPTFWHSQMPSRSNLFDLHTHFYHLIYPIPFIVFI
jgi:hypothetical protein